MDGAGERYHEHEIKGINLELSNQIMAAIDTVVVKNALESVAKGKELPDLRIAMLHIITCLTTRTRNVVRSHSSEDQASRWVASVMLTMAKHTNSDIQFVQKV